MSQGFAEYGFDVGRLTEGVLLRRVWAWLVDFLLVGVVVAILWVLLFGFGLLTLGLGFPLLAVLPVVPFVYHSLFLASGRSATPGQVMMDLVVRRDEDLGQPSLLQAVLFTAGLWLTLGAGVIWLAAAMFTARNRALHDLISGLVVVRSGAFNASLAGTANGALTGTAGFVNMRRGPPYA